MLPPLGRSSVGGHDTGCGAWLLKTGVPSTSVPPLAPRVIGHCMLGCGRRGESRRERLVVGLGAWGIWDAGAGAFNTQSIFARQSLARPESDTCWRVKTAPRTSEPVGQQWRAGGPIELAVKHRAARPREETVGGVRDALDVWGNAPVFTKWGFVGCEMSRTNGLQSIYRLLVSLLVSCAGTSFLTSPHRSVAWFSRPNMCGGARIPEHWLTVVSCRPKLPGSGSSCGGGQPNAPAAGRCKGVTEVPVAQQSNPPWWKSLRAIFAGPCRTGFPNGQSRDSRGNSRLHFGTDLSTSQDEIVRSERTRRFPHDSD